MYHAVSSTIDSPLFSGMHGVTVEDFECQLSYLIKNGTALNERDVFTAAKTENYPKDDSFYLTFDDGFKQHFNNVFPVLKDYGIQASFFVPTMPIESYIVPIVEKQRLLQYNLFSTYQEFLEVFCGLARKVSRIKDKSVLYPNNDNINNSKDYLQEYNFYSSQERLFRLIRNEYLSVKDFTSIVNNMFSKFYCSDKKFIDEYFMSASDLKTMNDNNMVIGGHSYSHPFLNKIASSEMKIEIDRSMSFLRKTIDKGVNSFAYPFGVFNDDIVEYLYQENIDYAFDTRSKGSNHRYNLKRIDATSFFNKTKV